MKRKNEKKKTQTSNISDSSVSKRDIYIYIIHRDARFVLSELFSVAR